MSCIAADLVEGDLGALPADVDYVLNFAVVKTGDWDRDLAPTPRRPGMLMAHCRDGRRLPALLVDRRVPAGRPAPLREDDPLGDNHRRDHPDLQISKIAAEAVARFCARAVRTCPPPSPASTCPTATTAAGPTATSR